jgi:acetyl-CoA carboxylase biotin carboxyl carrier protein
VKVGDRVKVGQTLCIIEAMKLLNEIESEFDGVVQQILVDNAQGVEFDQPLYVIA